jgi:hypothetical protein
MDIRLFEYYVIMIYSLYVPKKNDVTKPGVVYDHFGLFDRSSAMRRNRRKIGLSVGVAGSQDVAGTERG